MTRINVGYPVKKLTTQHLIAEHREIIGYGLLHVFVLIPVRFYAILTLRDGKWGTR